MDAYLQKCKALYQHRHENTAVYIDPSYSPGNPDDHGSVFIPRCASAGGDLSSELQTFHFFSLFSLQLGPFANQEVAIAKKGLNHHYSKVVYNFFSKGIFIMKLKFTNALSLALIVAMLFTSVGLADDVVNNLDLTVDAALEATSLTAGGVTKTVDLYINPENGDGKNGCNLTGGTSLVVNVISSNSSVASVSPAQLTFTNCEGVLTNLNTAVTVTPLAAGTTNISLALISENADGTFNLAPASFTVNVNPPAVQNQTITVTQAAPLSEVYGSSFNVAATGGGSGNPVVITTSGVCSGGGNGSATISMTSGTGTCSVFYNQAGGPGYNAAPQVSSNTAAQKANATVNVTPYNTTYDGQPHTATGSATGAKGEDLNSLLDLSGTTHTDAGAYNGDLWSFTGDGNHNSANGSVNDSIGQASVTATAGGGSATFDGSTHAPSGCTVTGDYTGDLSCVNNPASAGPDAGTHTISPVVSGTGLSNFAITSVNGSFTIDKAATTTIVTCEADPFTYTGSAHTPCSAKVTGPGGLDQSLAVIYTDNINAGTATASASYEESANYSASSDSETFEIGKAATTTTVTCAAGPFTYTGSPIQPCSASVTGPDGLDESLSVDYLNNTNAGQATASASYAESDNYLGSSDSENFTIDKASSTTTVSCDAGPFSYNGLPHTPCTASYSTSDGQSGSLTVDYSNNVNAGTASASATYPGDANHEASSDSKTFTIDKAATTTTVVCQAGPFTYNGLAHTPCSAEVTGPGGLSETLSVSYENNVNAGQATASAAYAESANYLASTDSENFTIDKAPSTTTVSCPTNVTYTGAALEPCSASVTGAGGLDELLAVGYSDNVNAGIASASASYPGDANHEASSDTEAFTIDKAPSITTVICEAGPFLYNGSAHEPCSASVTGAGGLDESLTVSYSNNVNAGTATASASYAGDANHEASNDSETFTIDKANATCTVTGYSVIYDGNSHTATGLCTGVLGESLSGLDLSGTTHTLVGNYTDSWTFTDVTGNYNNASGTVNNAILAWTLKGFYQPVDMNGVVNTVKGGSTVPLKFEVFAGSTELTNTAIVSSLVKQVTCNASAEDTIELLATGGTSMRYDTTSGQFIFNWQTPKLPGKCYSVTLTALDGSSITALFKLK